MEEGKRRVNPHQWAYRRYFTGRADEQLLQLSVMTQDYQRREVLQLLEELCRVVRQVAVSSSLLTAHQRRKYRERKVNRSKWVYYLFPVDSVPYDVYARLQPRDNQYVYTREA